MKHDLAEEPPSRELLERLVDQSHPKDFLNKRSPAHKARRPIVVRDPKRAVFGFDAGAYNKLK